VLLAEQVSFNLKKRWQKCGLGIPIKIRGISRATAFKNRFK
jgi:hypothetical protein